MGHDLDDESDLNHLVFGLIASPSNQRLTQDAFAGPTTPKTQQATIDNASATTARLLVDDLPDDLEKSLLEVYHKRAQAQYPFFH